MNFHLQFPITPSEKKINYEQKIMFTGSCFSENIGEKMLRYKFDAAINPHGILYNPKSIAKAITRYVNNDLIREEELFFANDCWNSWEHHSRFSNPDKQSCIAEINNNITSSYNFLKEAEWLFITLGSAYSYSKKDLNETIGNCHKVPQKEFTKSLLTIESIVEEYNFLIQKLHNFNPKINIVFTVSPVRYIRDGVVENNLSKSILINAVHEIVKQNSNAFYFPAYELVIDDLRDYRFYKEDLVHPNEQAIEYVFEKMKNVFFCDEANILFDKIDDLVTAKEHRPFNELTDEHKKFKSVYFKRTELLQKEFPFVNLKEELDYFKAL
jgi:hypothetical protein